MQTVTWVIHDGTGTEIGPELGTLNLSADACDGEASEACRALEAFCEKMFGWGSAKAYSPDGDIGCVYFTVSNGFDTRSFFLVSDLP